MKPRIQFTLQQLELIHSLLLTYEPTQWDLIAKLGRHLVPATPALATPATPATPPEDSLDTLLSTAEDLLITNGNNLPAHTIDTLTEGVASWDKELLRKGIAEAELASI